MSTTVRVSDETHGRLRDLAQETGQSMQAVLARALDAYRRELFFQSVDAAYERLWSDPEASREELAERALWEGTLADGLKDDW